MIAVRIDEGDGGVAEAFFNQVIGLGDGFGLVGAAFAAHAEFGFDADVLALDIEADKVGDAAVARAVGEGVLRIRLDSRFLQDAGEVRI